MPARGSPGLFIAWMRHRSKSGAPTSELNKNRDAAKNSRAGNTTSHEYRGAVWRVRACGGLVQAGLNDTHTKAYTQIVKERQIVFAPLLEKELTRELESAGYHVVYSEERPIVKEDNRTVAYSAIQTDADAILHVWFTTRVRIRGQGRERCARARSASIRVRQF